MSAGLQRDDRLHRPPFLIRKRLRRRKVRPGAFDKVELRTALADLLLQGRQQAVFSSGHVFEKLTARGDVPAVIAYFVQLVEKPGHDVAPDGRSSRRLIAGNPLAVEPPILPIVLLECQRFVQAEDGWTAACGFLSSFRFPSVADLRSRGIPGGYLAHGIDCSMCRLR